ncbi:hypothetical protein [Azotobacter salinestris]|uniref:hypothetical protein n=1 Tax=Azotobacter salinestris TaxID=69964 RepID=UPI00142EE1CD|nr:hypothetical protein [Azotobacter salinestris]
MKTSTPSNTASSLTTRTTTGKMLVDIEGGDDFSYDLALQADGRILMAGSSY